MQNLKKELNKAKIDSLFVTNPININYLTGFKGISPTEREALLVIRSKKSTLITAKLYQSEAKKVASLDLEVKIAAERNEYQSFIKDAFKSSKKLGFESNDLKYNEYKKFKKYLRKGNFTPTENLIENLRIIKSKEELKNIEKAQKISQKAFDIILPTIKLGQIELEITQKLLQIMASLGSQGTAFDPIVASGPNAALPHHQTGKRKIKRGDCLLFDFGAKYQNYCADLSRTIFIGKPSDEQTKVYELVTKSQKRAIRTIKSGLKANKAFGVSHKVFKDNGVDKNFIHSLGHGIGLEVHEKPSINAKSKDTLVKGMVFSIEPGLYYSWGGVRIEDLVTITNNNARILGKPASFIQIL